MKLLFASFLAAVAVFLWGFVSWMVLPWHQSQWARFTDEEAVAKVLQQNAQADPHLYVLPHRLNSEGGKVDDATWQAASMSGPFFYGTVRAGPRDEGLALLMVRSFLIQWLGAFFLALILQHCPRQTLGGRVAVCVQAGVFAGIVAWVPEWNWWQLPPLVTAINILDIVIGALVAGLVLARLVHPHSHPYRTF